MDATVKLTQQEADDAVANIRSDLNRTLTGMRREQSLVLEEARLQTAAAVNKTHLEASEAIKQAQEARMEAVQQVPTSEARLIKSRQALETAEAAHASAMEKKVQYKAWAEAQLTSAVTAAKHASTAARAYTSLVKSAATETQPGALLATP